MSRILNRTHRVRRVIEESLRCISVKYGGSQLSKRDSQTYLAAVNLQSLLLHDLLTDGSPELLRHIKPWLDTVVHCDAKELAVMLKSLLSYFRNYETGPKCDYTGFKRQFCKQHPLVGAFMAPIKGFVEEYLSSLDPSCFRIICQHISFISHLQFKDVDYKTDCLEGYLNDEIRLSQIEYSPVLMNELNLIIREWFSEIDFSGIIPKHGPGSVSGFGRISIDAKYRLFGTDAALDYLLNRIGLTWKDLSPLQVGSLDRTCELVFVAKSMLTNRVISKEPATLQYLQHGFSSAIDQFMGHHPHLRHCIQLHDQSINREFAQVGSVSGKYATIDLSSASDSVTWRLVKAAFAHTPLLLPCYATRSKFVLLPNGDKVPLEKFAPMGSALCFPVECIIFLALCELAVRRSGFRSREQVYVVYGDDIVIHHAVVEELLVLLRAFGFIVNTEKSFTARDSHFRESCGGEYLFGVDVTPLRLGRKFSAVSPGPSHPGTYTACIDEANLAARYGFRNVRGWFVTRLLHLPPHYRPKFSAGFEALYSSQPTNFHLRFRRNENLQIDEVRHGVVSSRPLPLEYKDDCNETIRLFEWYRLTATRKYPVIWPDDLIVASTSRSMNILRSGYSQKVPCEESMG